MRLVLVPVDLYNPANTGFEDQRQVPSYILHFPHLSIEEEFIFSTSRILFLAYFLVVDAFTLLDIGGASKGEMKSIVPNVAVEITRGFWLTAKWNEMFARYAISLSKFKSKQQLCFSAKVNIIHIQRLHDGLNALVK